MSWKLPHMDEAPEAATRANLLAELPQVEAELANAIYMHRAAWVKARARRDELSLEVQARHPGDLRAMAAELGALCETDPKYTRRIGDVKFWLAERAGLAATVTAIVAMLEVRPARVGMRVPWTEGRPHGVGCPCVHCSRRRAPAPDPRRPHPWE